MPAEEKGGEADFQRLQEENGGDQLLYIPPQPPSYQGVEPSVTGEPLAIVTPAAPIFMPLI